MRCKCCGKEMILTPYGLNASMTPMCKCGKVRKRVREEGCPSCGATDDMTKNRRPDPNIMLIKKDWRGYHFTCKCGHTWRVRE